VPKVLPNNIATKRIKLVTTKNISQLACHNHSM
jgi:hypothetical protein